MYKSLLLPVCATLLLTSCDVRKKDQQAAQPATQQQPEEIKNPTTVQLIDSVYDFGSVKEGEIVEYSYRFKNTGNQALVVSNVQASCGCTVADKPEAPVKPGEIGYIKVKFNSDHRPGEAHKTVTVTSNAVPSFPDLLLKGTVVGKEAE
jgi:hypothetical protein